MTPEEAEENTAHDGHPETTETFQIVGTVSSLTEEKCSYIAEEYSVNISQYLTVHYMIMQ